MLDSISSGSQATGSVMPLIPAPHYCCVIIASNAPSSSCTTSMLCCCSVFTAGFTPSPASTMPSPADSSLNLYSLLFVRACRRQTLPTACLFRVVLQEPSSPTQPGKQIYFKAPNNNVCLSFCFFVVHACC